MQPHVNKPTQGLHSPQPPSSHPHWVLPPARVPHRHSTQHAGGRHQAVVTQLHAHAPSPASPPSPSSSAGAGAASNSPPSGSSTRRSSSSHSSWQVQPLRAGEVWYLGYGSNMNPQVLTGRRRVKPQHSLPCYVPGYRLSFGVQGFPWAEPGFATIAPCDGDCHRTTAAPPPAGQQRGANSSGWRRRMCAGSSAPCLHAVLHRISRREWELVKASEGVLGGDSSGVGYQVVEVDCVLYDDTTIIKAVTLQAAAASLHRSDRAVQPSARYLSLLQAGGRHHGLDSHYQQWLDGLQPYQPPSVLQAAIGSAASGAVLLSAAYTAVPAYLLSRAAAGSGSSSPAGTAASASHDGAMPHVQPADTGGAAAPSSSSPAGGSSSDAAAENSSSSSGPPEGFFPFLRWYTGSSQQMVWDVHDSLAPWLGSGSSADKQP